MWVIELLSILGEKWNTLRKIFIFVKKKYVFQEFIYISIFEEIKENIDCEGFNIVGKI